MPETTIVSTGFGSVNKDNQVDAETNDSNCFKNCFQKFNKNTSPETFRSNSCKQHRRRESVHSVVIMSKLQNFSTFITKLNLIIHLTLLVLWVSCNYFVYLYWFDEPMRTGILNLQAAHLTYHGLALLGSFIKEPFLLKMAFYSSGCLLPISIYTVYKFVVAYTRD